MPGSHTLPTSSLPVEKIVPDILHKSCGFFVSRDVPIAADISVVQALLDKQGLQLQGFFQVF